MSKTIVGVIGPGSVSDKNIERDAFELGRRIAAEGWVLLSGGRNVGVMDAVSEGAREAGGITIGVLGGEDRSSMSRAVDIPIVTGMGQARNNINVLSSDVLIACGTGPGTASEISLGIKANKTIILLDFDQTGAAFFQALSDKVLLAETPQEAIELARKTLR